MPNPPHERPVTPESEAKPTIARLIVDSVLDGARRLTATVAETLGLTSARFRTDEKEIDFRVDLPQETVWATQQQIADLFGVGVPAVSKHISNIYADGELTSEATLSKMETVRSEDGREVRRTLDHYNLDMILAVGYRVSSKRATEFRRWATKTLRAYVIDGYALNECRLRDDPDALQNLAARVRALRSDEKQVYAAVRECFRIRPDRGSPAPHRTAAPADDQGRRGAALLRPRRRAMAGTAGYCRACLRFHLAPSPG